MDVSTEPSWVVLIFRPLEQGAGGRAGVGGSAQLESTVSWQITETKVQFKSPHFPLSPHYLYSLSCAPAFLYPGDLYSVFQTLAYRQQYIQRVYVRLRTGMNRLPESV